ncbi:uncharacterized protein METZ01_LOCUS484821, partial [marine metagenome]
MRLVTLVVAGLLVAESPVFAQESLQLSGWADGIRMPEAPDLNPDPRIVEINLEARVETFVVEPGLTVEAGTYNG